jgi:solute carrier family 6 (neurotransmitter transporter, glycine) member 5/9
LEKLLNFFFYAYFSGHLSHELQTDIATVVSKSNGPGLSFISYPETISKFQHFPQVFSAIFFLMLYLLGIGSNVAMTQTFITVIREAFKKVKQWQAALGFAIFGTTFGAIYLTQVRIIFESNRRNFFPKSFFQI